MIIDFVFYKVLSMINSGTIDPKFLNPAATDQTHDRWNRFMRANVKMQAEIRQRLKRNHRIDFGFIDRTGLNEHLINVTVPEDQRLPVLDSTKSPRDYYDICIERAENLLATNKQLNVMWSGGMDSTVALFSLLRTAKHTDQVVLYCSIESILESGAMYDRYIAPLGVRVKFNQVRAKGFPYSYDYEDTEQLYITGDCGDHVFGPKNFFSLPNQKDTDPWDAGYSNDILDIAAPTIAHSPRPIKTAADFKWWLEYNFCWNGGYNDHRRLMPRQIATRIHPFYTTQEFQTWACVNDWFPGVPGQYRQPAKAALARMIDYDYYFEKKSKGQSVWVTQRKDWYMTDVDHNHYFQVDNNT